MLASRPKRTVAPGTVLNVLVANIHYQLWPAIPTLSPCVVSTPPTQLLARVSRPTFLHAQSVAGTPSRSGSSLKSQPDSVCSFSAPKRMLQMFSNSTGSKIILTLTLRRRRKQPSHQLPSDRAAPLVLVRYQLQLSLQPKHRLHPALKLLPEAQEQLLHATRLLPPCSRPSLSKIYLI